MRYCEITITDSVRLNDAEIQAIIDKAEAHATEYTQQRLKIEAQVQAQQLKEKLATHLAQTHTALPNQLTTKIEHALHQQPINDWVAYKNTLQTLWQQAHQR